MTWLTYIALAIANNVASKEKYQTGLKPGRVIRVKFCPGQVGLTRFIKYRVWPGFYIASRALLMAFGPGDDGSVFPNSAQDVLNLVIDSHYILKRKKDMTGSRAWQQFRIAPMVSLAVLFRVGCRETRIVFNPANTEWRLKVFGVAKESKRPSTSVSLFNRVISGSVGHPGQWYWPGFNPDIKPTITLYMQYVDIKTHNYLVY